MRQFPGVLLRPLPAEVDGLLRDLQAPPRLIAHLSLVHDVACQLTARLKSVWPELTLDEEAVHLGAAIHDIGKTAYPKELSEPGREHEAAGRDLLVRRGWPDRLSQFAITHGRNLNASDSLEDLLVAVADHVWKGKRSDQLEQALVFQLAHASRQEPWQVWLTLDDMFTALAESAPERLHWQGLHGL